MATRNALDKAVAEKIKEYTKIATAEKKAGRELTEGFRSAEEIQERARQAVLREMNAVIAAELRDDPGSPGTVGMFGESVVSAGPQLESSNTAGAGVKSENVRSELKGEKSTEMYAMATEWKDLDGMDAKKIQDMVHRFEFDEYNPKEMQFEDWQHLCVARIAMDLKMLGFIYESDSAEMQVFAQYSSRFSTSGYPEEARDFVVAEFWDENFLVGQLLDGGLFSALSKAIMKLNDRAKILREHDGILRRSQPDGVIGEMFSGLTLFACIRKHLLATNESLAEKSQNFIMDNSSDGRSFYPPHIKFVESHFELFSKNVDTNELYAEYVCADIYIKTMHKLFPGNKFIYIGQLFDSYLKEIAEKPKEHKVTFLRISEDLSKAISHHRNFTPHLFSGELGGCERHAKPNGFTRDSNQKKKGGSVQNALDAKNSPKGEKGKGKGKKGSSRPFAQPLEGTKTRVCFDFQKHGKCKRDNCPYAHLQAAQVTRPKKPCHFFPRGKCTKGDKCEFEHVVKQNFSHTYKDPATGVVWYSNPQTPAPPPPAAQPPAVSQAAATVDPSQVEDLAKFCLNNKAIFNQLVEFFQNEFFKHEHLSTSTTVGVVQNAIFEHDNSCEINMIVNDIFNASANSTDVVADADVDQLIDEIFDCSVKPLNSEWKTVEQKTGSRIGGSVDQQHERDRRKTVISNRFALLFQPEMEELKTNFSPIPKNLSFTFPNQVKLEIPKAAKARKGKKSKSLKNLEIPENSADGMVEIPAGDLVEIPKNAAIMGNSDFSKKVQSYGADADDDDDILVDTGANLSNFHSHRKGISIKMRCLIKTVSGLLEVNQGKKVELVSGVWLTGTVNDKGPELLAGLELTSGLNCDLVISKYQAYLQSKTGHRIYLKIKNGLPYLTKEILQELEDSSHFLMEYREILGNDEKFLQHPLNRITMGNKSKISKSRKLKNLEKLCKENIFEGSDSEILKRIEKKEVLDLSDDVFQKIGKLRHRQSRRKNATDGLNSFHRDFSEKLKVWGDKYLTSLSSDTGKFNDSTLFGNVYFTIFVDSLSLKPYVGFKQTNSAECTLENFQTCFGKREMQHMLHFHSDGGTEYLGCFNKFLKKDLCLDVTTSNPYQPAENGQAERVIGQLKTESQVLLNASGLPYIFSEQAMVFHCQESRSAKCKLEPKLPFSFGELCIYRASPVAHSRGRLGLFLHLSEDALPSLKKNSFMLLDFRSLGQGILRFIRSDRIVSTHANKHVVREMVHNIFSTLDFGVKSKDSARKAKIVIDDDPIVSQEKRHGVEEFQDGEPFDTETADIDMKSDSGGEEEQADADAHRDNFNLVLKDFLKGDDVENVGGEVEKVFDFDEDRVIEIEKVSENVENDDKSESRKSCTQGGDLCGSEIAENEKVADSEQVFEKSPETSDVPPVPVESFKDLIHRFNTSSPPKVPDTEREQQKVDLLPNQLPDRGIGKVTANAERAQMLYDVNGLADIVHGIEFGTCKFLDMNFQESDFTQSEYEEHFKGLDHYLQFEHELLNKSDPRYFCPGMSAARIAEWNTFKSFDVIGKQCLIADLSPAEFARLVFPVEVSSIKFPSTPNEKFKYRLTANGRRVKQELFTTINTLEHSSRRILQYYACRLNMQCGASDAKSGYLQAQPENFQSYFLKAPAWMMLPNGTVFELRRPIYGLPDSGRHFQEYVEKCLKKIGFVQFESFKGVFRRGKELIGTYVDDLFLVSKDVRKLNSEIIQAGLLLQDVEVLTLENSINFNGIDLSLEKCEKTGHIFFVEDMNRYTQKIIANFLKMTGKSELRKTDAPGTNRKDDIFNRPSTMLDKLKDYDPHTILAQTLYLCRGCRPDISCAVSFLARQVHAWSEGADFALCKLVSYLSSYPTGRLRLKQPPADYCVGFESVLFFSDADLGGDLLTSRSTGGDLTFLRWGENETWLLSWTSKMLSQKCTSTPWSEMAALQRGLQSSAMPSSHLCELITGFECPIRAMQDNAAVIQSLSWGYSLALRYLARHSRLSISKLHHLFSSNANCITYVPSGKNSADLMTKPLDPGLHWHHTLNLGMCFD